MKDMCFPEVAKMDYNWFDSGFEKVVYGFENGVDSNEYETKVTLGGLTGTLPFPDGIRGVAAKTNKDDLICALRFYDGQGTMT